MIGPPMSWIRKQDFGGGGEVVLRKEAVESHTDRPGSFPANAFAAVELPRQSATLHD